MPHLPGKAIDGAYFIEAHYKNCIREDDQCWSHSTVSCNL